MWLCLQHCPYTIGVFELNKAEASRLICSFVLHDDTIYYFPILWEVVSQCLWEEKITKQKHWATAIFLMKRRKCSHCLNTRWLLYAEGHHKNICDTPTWTKTWEKKLFFCGLYWQHQKVLRNLYCYGRISGIVLSMRKHNVTVSDTLKLLKSKWSIDPLSSCIALNIQPTNVRPAHAHGGRTSKACKFEQMRSHIGEHYRNCFFSLLRSPEASP